MTFDEKYFWSRISTFYQNFNSLTFNSKLLEFWLKFRQSWMLKKYFSRKQTKNPTSPRPKKRELRDLKVLVKSSLAASNGAAAAKRAKKMAIKRMTKRIPLRSQNLIPNWNRPSQMKPKKMKKLSPKKPKPLNPPHLKPQPKKNRLMLRRLGKVRIYLE